MTGPALPPEIERLIEVVLSAANLDFVDGRAEVEHELRAHFEDGLHTGATPDELITRFGDPVEAGRRIARTRPRAAARNRGEQGRWWMSGAEWWDEVRKAGRRLRRAPGFAVIVIVTLALGIGANTAIFTVLDAVLLDELPYEEPDRLVRLHEADQDAIIGEYLRVPMVTEWRSWDEIFENVSALYTYREMGADITSGDRPERVHVLWVSADYFETLGIAPERGRTFLEGESYGPGEATSREVPIARTAIVSHRLWTDFFGGVDPVGESLQLDGSTYEVVGVMPRGFQNPFGTDADVWLPYDMRMGGSNHYSNWFISGIARLRDGITLEQARERARALGEAHYQAEPNSFEAFPLLLPLQEDVVGSTRALMLWILAGAAGMVLLAACLNVTNLLVARGLSRERDVALRAALGSARSRIVTAALVENGILAIAGGVAGLILGAVGVRVLLSIAPDVIPMVTEVRLGARVLLFTTTVTVGALLIFGVLPALRTARSAPAEVLRSGDRAATAGRSGRRVRRGLVVAQVGVALALVAGAALFARSFHALVNVPSGFDPQDVLTFEVHLPSARYPDGASRDAFHEEFHRRVTELPGVESVGAISWLPLSERYHTWSFYWDPANPDGSNEDGWYRTDVRVVAGDYFDAMGIEVLYGADVGDVDFESGAVAWVSQTIADQVFHDVEPLGQQVYLGDTLRTIVGVVADVAHNSRGEMIRTSYIPHPQFADNRNWALTQVVRTHAGTDPPLGEIREAIHGVDGQLVLFQPSTAEDLVASVREQDRFAASLMASFAVLALILSLVGTYGVLAGAVAARSREIGIRMALGASLTNVRRMVLEDAARLVVPGIVAGLIVAYVGAQWVRALLFQIEARDPLSLTGAALVFLVVGFLAAWIPARRATRVNTTEVLARE